MTSRRAFLFGAASAALVAPAIVRASSLMKLWVPKRELVSTWDVGAADKSTEAWIMYDYKAQVWRVASLDKFITQAAVADFNAEYGTIRWSAAQDHTTWSAT